MTPPMPLEKIKRLCGVIEKEGHLFGPSAQHLAEAALISLLARYEAAVKIGAEIGHVCHTKNCDCRESFEEEIEQKLSAARKVGK